MAARCAGSVKERLGGCRRAVDSERSLMSSSGSSSCSYVGLSKGEVSASSSDESSVGTKPMPGVSGVWVRGCLAVVAESSRQERQMTPVRRIMVPRVIWGIVIEVRVRGGDKECTIRAASRFNWET